jgi:trk system potassium uptake protein TrkH
MIIAGINFSLHYKLIAGDFKTYFKDTEFRVFIFLVAAFPLIVTFDVFGKMYDSIFSAFRFASFQVSSIISTTGFATADYELWPALSKYILLLCMFLGGMAGSTSGGLKTMRIILLIKQGYRELFRIIHPHSVTSIKLGGRPVPPEVLSSIWGFFILYMALFVITSMFMAFLGLDLFSSYSCVAACRFKVGPGLGLVGPVDNYMDIPLAGKWVLIFCMLLGRLEIYTVIVLLTPEYWRK